MSGYAQWGETDIAATLTCEPVPPRNESARGIAEHLERRLGPHKYGMWFGHTDMSVEAGRLKVATDSPFAARWIDTHFSDDLKDAARSALGEDVSIDVCVATELRTDDAAHHATNGHGSGRETANGHHSSTTESHRHNRETSTTACSHSRFNTRSVPLRRLEDFVVGTSNRLAYSAACRIAGDDDPHGLSPLFIHGECGVGKTHLLQGVCQRWIDITGRSTGVRYVTGEEFTNEFISAIRNDKLDSFRTRTRKLNLLAIDDVHFLSNKVRTQSEFLYTLDAIGLSGARVVMASDDHPRHIRKFNQALVSRFLSGMVVKIDRPDRPMRIELIQRLAAVRGLIINPAAVDQLAGHCVGSVRELEGAITKLAAYQDIMVSSPSASPGATTTNGHAPNEIGVLLTGRLFQEQSAPHGAPIRIATVIELVCTRLNVTRADLIGSGRHRRVVLARALVAYLSRELTTHSFPEIAQALGRTFHSTIHTADQRLRRQLADNEMTDVLNAAGRTSLRELADQLRYEIVRDTA